MDVLVNKTLTMQEHFTWSNSFNPLELGAIVAPFTDKETEARSFKY